jgi:hypothetical protein
MTERHDNDLRKRFEMLRGEDAELAPPFPTIVARARARRAARPRQVGPSLAAAAVLIVMAVLAFLFTRRDGSRVAIDLAAVRWEAPTDFLLKLPGDELLRAVPLLGRVSLDRRIL